MEQFDKQEIAETLTELLEEYGDCELATFAIGFALEKPNSPGRLDKEEALTLHLCHWLHKQVKAQVDHLATLYEEPLPNPATMTEEEQRGLSDDINFGRRDEHVAARVNLVRLHEPNPPELGEAELVEWLDHEHRQKFVPRDRITIREAFDYLMYWRQVSATADAMEDFLGQWESYNELARLVGDEEPKTINDLAEYQKRLHEEGE